MRTVQYEGVADQPTGSALEVLLQTYLRIFPDGRARQAWPDLVYYRVRPTWLRFSDFATVPATQIELTQAELLALAWQPSPGHGSLGAG